MQNPLKLSRKSTSLKACIVGLAMSVAGCAADPTRTNTPPQLAETGRVYGLVEARKGAKPLQQAGVQMGFTARAPINLPGLGFVMVPFDLPQTVTGKEAIDRLERAVPGSTVGVNHAYQMQAVAIADPTGGFANKLLNWPQGGCRARRTIGLIDGGIERAALDMPTGRITQRNFVDPTAQGLRHGTETASVLMNPTRLRNARVFSANVVGQEGGLPAQASATGIVEALDWLVRNDVGVANISLAGPFNKLLALGVQSAQQRDLVIVAAAGNDRRVASVQYPAALPDVIAVTAVDANQKVWPTAVRGDHIDFAAPGVDIMVGTSAGNRFMSGTSLAAPFVTAALATQPRLNPDVFKTASVDLGRPNKDAVFGHGLIQALQNCAK